MTITRWLLVLALVGVARPVQAQTPAPITGFEVRVFIAATNTTVTRAIPLTAVSCNLAPLPAPVGVLVNPTTVQWDDDTIPGRVCRASVGNFFEALPPA